MLAHRGPDDNGIFVDSNSGIGLAHTRLSILDISSLGHQPMISADGRVVLVYNGEIYNFRELRIELQVSGHEFKGHSDTEVLLQLYLSWKTSGSDLATLLRRLNGIFALAIWDADRDALLLARDAFGVKPLYYQEDDGHFYFSSEIKALLSLTRGLGELDWESIHRYLSFLWCPGEGTPARTVKKLPPGHYLWVRKGCIVERCTWYNLPVFSNPLNNLSEKYAIRKTVEKLRRAVHRQMVADVPLGAFLSGGLDSSSVVAFAREINPNICCFTIESIGRKDGGVINDLPYAQKVAKHLGVSLQVVQINPVRMAADLEAMVAQLDEPLADPASLNVLYISQIARNQGIKVLLSGAGGDDLFTGYLRHQAVIAERFWDWLPESLRRGLNNWTSKLDQRINWARKIRKAFDGAILEGDARLVNYFIWAKRSDLVHLYTPDFRSAIDSTSIEKPMLEFLSRLPASVPRLERLLALEQRFFLADHNLIYTDKMSMAAGVEVRVPFLDIDLVEFAHQIPANYKQRGCTGKWVLKKAMEPYLPRDVIYRPKTGFGAPLRRWLRFELRDWMGDILNVSSLSSRGLFNPHAVQKLIADNDSGRVDASYTLFSLICIEIWCRRFYDKS